MSCLQLCQLVVRRNCGDGDHTESAGLVPIGSSATNTETCFVHPGRLSSSFSLQRNFQFPCLRRSKLSRTEFISAHNVMAIRTATAEIIPSHV